MSSIYHGRNAAIGIGEESTWGTAVARSNYRPLISASVARVVEKVPRPSLRVGSSGAMRRSNYISSDLVSGSFSVECTYENLGMFLKHLMGNSTTASTEHTYKIANDLPTGLTLELIRGTGSSEIFEGCRLNTGTFSVSAGGVLTFEAEVIGETSAEGSAEVPSVAPRSAGGTASYGSGDTPVLHSHAGQLSFDGNNYTVNDFSVTINNGIATRMKLGSAATLQPLRSDYQSVECSFSLDVEDNLYKAMVANTESDASITFTSGSRTWQFNVQNAVLTAASDPVSEAGIVSQSCSLMAQSDGTNEGLTIVVDSGDASATAN